MQVICAYLFDCAESESNALILTEQASLQISRRAMDWENGTGQINMCATGVVAQSPMQRIDAC